MRTSSTTDTRIVFQQSGFKSDGGFLWRTGTRQQPHVDTGGFQCNAGAGPHTEPDHGPAISQQSDKPIVIVGMGMRLVMAVFMPYSMRGLVIGSDLPALDLAIFHAENEKGGAPPKMS